MMSLSLSKLKWTGIQMWFVGLIGLAGVAGVGCYNPSILDGGLICADAGKRCPDGFECGATDQHCHAVVKCSAPAAPICQDAARSGAACNPACQSGCSCGRCNVAGSEAVCTPTVGTVALRQVCTPTKDNCAAGLICLLEADTCGAGLGRCYQHCTTSGSAAAQCGTTGACEIPILDGAGKDTSYRACGLGTQLCNPVLAANTNNGCPSTALGCYVNPAGATYCDCPNRATAVILGGVCEVYNDCAPGLICTDSSGSAGRHCRQACTIVNPTCPNGQRCIGVGAIYGYCAS
jgi:hypothetical protein